MPNNTPSSAVPITLGPKWFSYCRAAGLDPKRDADVAVALKLDPSTVYRVREGLGAPSAKFIRAAMVFFETDDFNGLFRVVRPKRAKVGATR